SLRRSAGDSISGLLATGVPSQLSWGFVSGYCAGFSAKKAGKVLAVGVGAVFALMQGLAYSGYIVVDHQKLEKDFRAQFDTDSDGELQTTLCSINGPSRFVRRVLYDRALRVLQFNVPSGSGFFAGP
ncbi:hypothetical protein M885DRAFT_443625, partial [Pelagophyceae sp. CCMP2097]